MKRKKITLSGVETNNKGAELMLYAILQEIERKYPDAIVYIHDSRIRQGLNYIKTNLELRYKPIVKWQGQYERFHIKGIAKRLHIDKVHLDDVYAIKGTDYFFDASGFMVSDQWNLDDYFVKKWDLLLKRNESAGAKIVFLPQAFGPIEKENTIKLLSSINKYAKIIMPREKVSFDYLLSSGLVDMEKVKLHKDFTCLVEGTFPEKYSHLKNGICIIPNLRMVDKGSMNMEDYTKLLIAVIESTKEMGKPIYLLNHEGEGDERLAYKIQSTINNGIEVVTGLNALEVKGMIASAYLVVSSRFHGVASALNSCVPCLATSWSHKYEELFKDYGQKDCVLPLNNINQALDIFRTFIQEENNKRTSESLCKIKQQILNDTRKMWEDVWNA